MEVAARGAGGVVARRRLEATRGPVPPQRRAYIDHRHRLAVDGRPFFPLGMYWSGVKGGELAIYARSPFNCLMPYVDIGRSGLDLAQSNGLKVIYSIKDLYEGSRNLASREAADAAVRRTVAALRDHPAIIAWYINDEFPLARLEELVARQRLMEQLDPGRPTWAVLYQVHELRGYLPTCDVMGTDPYPIPRRPPRLALDWTRMTVRATFNARPIWMVPQAFNCASYKTTPEERAQHRAPTLAEMRVMAWSCIAAGADGLIFYSWFNLWRMDKLRSEGGRADTRDPFDDRWRDVTAMAAEIRDFVPVLLSDEPPPAVSSDAPDAVAVRTFRHGGRSYLLCVNADDAHSYDFRAEVEGAARMERTSLGAGPAPGLWDGRLHLAPLSICLLELAP